MGNIERHLETIPLPVLMMAGAGFILFSLAFPKKWGFYLSIFMMFSWGNMDRFQTVNILASAAKVTFWIPPVLIIWFSLFLPGPRRKIPVLYLFYLLCPVYGVFCILSTVDSIYGVIQFGTMFLYSAAALAVYRVTTDEARLKNVIVAMFLGILVPVGMSFAALVIFRSHAFRPGIGRFEPFGMGSNQYVHLFATACCFAGYGFTSVKKNWVRAVCLFVIAACGAMLISSGSRQGLVIVSIAMLPSIIWGMKNPILFGLGATLAVMVGIWVFAFGETTAPGRITDFSDTSGRVQWWQEYGETLLKRPAGLFGTRGKRVAIDDDASHITHNSYLRMAYLGGFGLIVPMMLMAVVSSFAMLRVVLKRNMLSIDSSLLLSLAALLLAVYLQGLVNDMIYLSAASWVFLHYFASAMFMGLAKELRNPAPMPSYIGPMAPTYSMRYQ